MNTVFVLRKYRDGLRKLFFGVNVSTLIRLCLRLWTFRQPVWSSGTAPISFPDTHQTWSLEQVEPTCILNQVAQAYVAVFADKPWEEHYEPEWVIGKLRRELASSSACLVTLKGNEAWPVAGFCWGVVATPLEVYQRILAARSMDKNETVQKKLSLLLLNGTLKLDDKFLFVDEIAILRAFRGGLSPIQFLIRPVFELGYQCGVHQTLFWTMRRSPIYPLALGMGFESVGEVDGIEYMFHPNFVPLLKVLQNMKPERIRTILSITSVSPIKPFRNVRRKLLKKFLEIKSQRNLVLKSR